MSLTVGSLFSGAGLMDWGLEQAGMETIWQVEYDDWTREVALPQNFPNTEKFKDVREVGQHNLRAVDVLAGGFPCQDISNVQQNGSQAKGLDGDKSGLWSEMLRTICELRPKYALIENVSRLLVFGMDRVLCDLARIGYDAEWKTLRASDFGLSSKRRRLFIIAYPVCKRLEKNQSVFGANIPNPKKRTSEIRSVSAIRLNDLEYKFPTIPEHLRMDNGITYELSEIKRAIKAYGNGVAVPCAKWIGEQIIRFDKEVSQL